MNFKVFLHTFPAVFSLHHSCVYVCVCVCVYSTAIYVEVKKLCVCVCVCVCFTAIFVEVKKL